ncbi:MAG TPA: GGDEF domain-containing protein [Coriobacteriia bacterium]
MEGPDGTGAQRRSTDALRGETQGTHRGSEPRLADLVALISRVAVGTIFISLFAVGALPADLTATSAMIAGLGVLVATGLFGSLSMLVLKVSPRRVLRTMLIPDLISSALIIFATGMHQDPFYPWMVGLAMIYGAGLALRESVFFASLVAVAYGVGHIMMATVAMHSSADIVIVVFKAVSIVVTAALVGNVARKQAARELQLRQSQRHYHELNEGLSRRLSELRAISEISEIIHSTLDFEQVGNLVLEIVSKVIDLPSSSLFVIDKRKDETLYSASFGVTPDVRRRSGDTYVPRAHPAGEEMFACTTILDRGTLLVVFCAAAERLEGLMAEDRLLLTAVANDLTIAVENSELYKLTKRMAITDELTGLNNYRFMLQRLDDEIERARRFGRNLSLLMLDADDFKLHNDTHGHVAGDAALSELAVAMQHAVRDIDVVCRYGGEEFAILLPETDADGAFVAAEKVREAVANHQFPDADGRKTERLTVSIGLSTFPRPAADREELLRQADDALYVAKRSGRNRVRASAGTAAAAREVEQAERRPMGNIT